jgi:hypothetical protein
VTAPGIDADTFVMNLERQDPDVVRCDQLNDVVQPR